MGQTRREFLMTAAAAGAAVALPWPQLTEAAATTPDLPALPAPDSLVHAMRRTSFGIREDELASARQMGLTNFLNQQLAPASIADRFTDADLAARYPTLSASPSTLAAYTDWQDVLYQLDLSTLYRAVYSRRQLYEVMVGFWSDHFNIFHASSIYNYLLKTVDDREVIRANAMGSFPDMLRASAHSPSMLVYLDGWINSYYAPNENYARELLELHTLGVGGGYTEQDIREIARCFTGWTVAASGTDVGRFRFDVSVHDTGQKTVLGQVIPAGGGVSDGETVLNIVAAHPSTARHIAYKLVRRFVSDAPPDALVATVANTYTATNGSITAMLRAILFSSYFTTSYDQKVTRPADFMVATMRALWPATSAFDSAQLYMYFSLGPMGHTPFFWMPPNGYPDEARHWVNSNGFVRRWQAIVALSENFGSNSPVVAMAQGTRTVTQMVDRLIDRLLHRRMSVGSSRVDLQACKLEYSIVSPK